MDRQNIQKANLQKESLISLIRDREVHTRACVAPCSFLDQTGSHVSVSEAQCWREQKGALVHVSAGPWGLSSGTLPKAISLNTEKLEGTNVFTRILFIIAIMLESKFSTIGKLLCKMCSGHSVGNYIAFRIILTKSLL